MVTVYCDICSAEGKQTPLIDLHNVKLKKIGVACCTYHSTDGHWHMFDFDFTISCVNPEKIIQFIYEDEDDSDWWKK